VIDPHTDFDMSNTRIVFVFFEHQVPPYEPKERFYAGRSTNVGLKTHRKLSLCLGKGRYFSKEAESRVLRSKPRAVVCYTFGSVYTMQLYNITSQ
jgi:hypothetical protein